MSDDHYPQYVKKVISAMRTATTKANIENAKVQLESLMLSLKHHRRRWALAFLVIIVYGMQGASVTTASAMTGSLPEINDKDIDVAVAFGQRAKKYPSVWTPLKQSAASAWPALEKGGDAIMDAHATP